MSVSSDYVREVPHIAHIRTPIILWSGAMTASLRTWPHDPSIGFLLLSGGHDMQRSLPNADVIASWEDDIAAHGFRHIRTNAVAPTVAQELRGLHYSTAQELCVMQANTYLAPVPPVADDLRPKRVHFSRYRIGRDNRITEQLVQLDCAAFGVEWGLDHIALREALRATTMSEIFMVRRQEIEGFILVGASDNRGYIQRLAVHPTHQRSGIAATLLSTALAWLRTRHCEETIVNTEFTNTAALNLYRKFGFRELPYHLSVMEKPVGH